MNYTQTLNYLYSKLPMYQRVGAAAYKPNLDNTLALCKLVGNPEKKIKTIHIAGTNGKGSTSHMIASVLQEAGYKVGLYTSPHLKDFRERIKINGKMISQSFIVDFVKQYRAAFENIEPSFFEMTVALAFDYFEKQKVDVAIIEVGLGGRLDSTNVITPLVSVITNISYDHMNLLGNTLPKIAAEKAGIIKPNGIVVISEKQKKIKAIFEQKAKKENATLIYATDFLKVKNAKTVFEKNKCLLKYSIKKAGTNFCELPGLYQQKNISAVFTTCFLLDTFFDFNISKKQTAAGIKNVITNTGLLGRWQVLDKSPITIADTGHNEAGIKEVLKMIKLTPHNKLHFVLGVVNDKDIKSILKLLPKKAHYYFCKAKIARALNEYDLERQASVFGLNGKAFKTVKSAIKAARKYAKKRDLIFIGGSTFTVADAI